MLKFWSGLFLVMLLSAPVLADDAPAKPASAAEILGEWKYAKGWKAGEEVAKERLVGKIVISKEEITITSAEVKFVFAYKLLGESLPAKVDMTITASPFGAGAQAKGLIDLTDGELTLAYIPEEGNDDYPEKLESTSSNRVHLFKLARGDFDAAAIVGKWKITSGKKAGEDLTAERLAQSSVEISDKAITLKGSAGSFVMAYTIGDGSPAKIDLTMTESPFGAGAKARGLISLTDGELKLIYSSEEGQEKYPEGFESTDVNRLHLFVMQKEKAE